ncbi:uncharacterized protein TNCV_1526411 [Trichonephila clavipes]|nr:uncharacterized protein TNCV_1526411 [Trichonephila clavipes]
MRCKHFDLVDMLVETKQRGEYWVCLCMRDTQQSFILRYICPMCEERIYFTENNFRERMATPPKTTLTAFFQLCQNDAFAKTLLYVDVPRYYTWNVSLKEWKRRVQGTHVNGWPGMKAGDALGRIYTVHVSNFKCYCLRMLLNVIQGPTNFLDLKTVDGQEFESWGFSSLIVTSH